MIPVTSDRRIERPLLGGTDELLADHPLPIKQIHRWPRIDVPALRDAAFRAVAERTPGDPFALHDFLDPGLVVDLFLVGPVSDFHVPADTNEGERPAFVALRQFALVWHHGHARDRPY
ncbi:MAG: hypothetical protein E6K70_21975 [Planctomycetota bacterium]|nr:MAG: hypothetical protein E6K70_21975 [Planctomycetota bacterium]